MQYKIGDCVVHPTHGVGTIVSLEEQCFFGEKPRLYLEVSMQRGTIWVPVETQEGINLRPLTLQKNLAGYRRLLKSHPVPLDENHRKRQIELSERLKLSSFESRCEIVRDLTARGWYKSLNEADSGCLRRAHQDLCQEWAVVAGISLADAHQEIQALLLEAREAYLS